MIKEYDVPLKQIWLEVVLIQASGNGKSKPDYPEEIQNIVKKMQSLFKFGKYTVIGRADAAGLEGATLRFGSSAIETNKQTASSFKVHAKIGCADEIIRIIEIQLFRVRCLHLKW